MDEKNRVHVTAWWVEVFGGPADYTDRHGGYPAMLAHHSGLSITADQRFRFATLMSLAADDAALPADPEFRAAFVGCGVGDTARAAQLSAGRENGPHQAPVPAGVGRSAAVPAVRPARGCG